MKANFIKTGLVIALSVLIFTSCKKSDISDVAPVPTQQKISFKQILSNPQFAKAYKEMEAKFNAENRSPGAQFILPYFTSSGFGLLQNGVVEEDCTSYPPYCMYFIVSGQMAFFDTQLGPKDFFRRNPDGTVTVHINSKIANANHYDIAPNVELTGTNANLNMTYTGAVNSFSYEDWETGELITIYYIDMFNTRGALSFHGNGKVRNGNTGPFKNLVSRWVWTPNGGPANSSFTLN